MLKQYWKIATISQDRQQLTWSAESLKQHSPPSRCGHVMRATDVTVAAVWHYAQDITASRDSDHLKPAIQHQEFSTTNCKSWWSCRCSFCCYNSSSGECCAEVSCSIHRSRCACVHVNAQAVPNFCIEHIYHTQNCSCCLCKYVME